jgi:hypothetical protein
MLTAHWASTLNVSEESSTPGDSFKRAAALDNDASLLDASWIGRECELQLLRRSSVIRVKIRPIELPTHGS